MNNENGEKSVSRQVTEAITSGRVKMRPKWHFILKTVLATSGVLFVLLALLYLDSLIIFISRRSGAWFAPAFGVRGIYVFLADLPWLLVLLAIIFVVVLELLARHYPLAYRQPLLYSVLAIIILTILGGYFLERTELHGRPSDCVGGEESPLAEPLYRQFNRQRLNDINQGEISQIMDNGMIIKNCDGEYLNIIFTPRTHLPQFVDFKPGEFVVVMGVRIGQNVQALGVSADGD